MRHTHTDARAIHSGVGGGFTHGVREKQAAARVAPGGVASMHMDPRVRWRRWEGRDVMAEV